MNKSLIAAGAGPRARIGAGTGAETGAGPGVGLWDGTREVLSEWKPSAGLKFLTSSSSTRSRRRKFRRGEWQRWDPPGVISVDDLIGLISRSSSKWVSWPIGYGAFKILKWSI